MDNTLKHYGIKGQKWGVINDDQHSRGTNLIARKKLEKEYLELKYDRQKTAAQFIGRTMLQIGKNTLSSFAPDVMKRLAKTKNNVKSSQEG